MTEEIAGWLIMITAALSAWYSWRRLVNEPRRLSNAVWLGITALLVGIAITLLGDGTLMVGSIIILILSPLLAACFAALLFWNGIVMLRRESFSLGNSLSLLSGVALLAAMIVSLVLAASGRMWIPIAVWIALATSWVALLFFGYLGYSWLYQRLIQHQRPNFVVALGSGLNEGRVTPLLAGRIDRALEVARNADGSGTAPVLIMSGGQGPDEPISEARAMGTYALERGQAPDSMLLEDASRTTEQNLRFTQKLVVEDPRLGPNSSGVAVTSSYHAMRAAMLARQLNIPIHVVGARTAGYFWPSAVLREFVAVVRETLLWQVIGFALITLPIPLVLAAML